ncbi:hypothetical protein JMM61_11875 [Rhodovulum sulfidophilum]|uniref:hypothetical protein n=1 Tax=Rhodovulum sulfidophilum TaxID=35806 RepID=UPI001928B3A7|nr:hypothetical protein [Rhodovulum sulfidophilum]MBL3586075.1 hypothetical protein [Rhodovulum sulfidophilum]
MALKKVTRTWQVGLIFLTLLVAIGNYENALNCDQGAICIDSYWTQFWLISYEDDFTRRALLGSIARALGGIPTDVYVLNVICLSIAIGLVILSVFQLRRFDTPFRNQLTAALIVGPSATVLIETVGDPLQVCGSITLAVAFLRGKVGAILSILAIPVVVAIHEASVFLYVPVLVCLAGRNIPPALMLRNTILVIVGLILLSVLLSEQQASSIGGALKLNDGSLMTVKQSPFFSYTDLLKDELDKHFGSLDGFVDLIRNAIGSLIWPLLFLIFLSCRGGHPQGLGNFIVLFLLSSPLYIIAHDWGRFAIHTLFGTFCITVCGVRFLDMAILSKIRIRLMDALAVMRGIVTAEMVLVFGFTYYSHRHYRLDGLETPNIVVLLALLLGMIALRRNNGSHSHASVDEGIVPERSPEA